MAREESAGDDMISDYLGHQYFNKFGNPYRSLLKLCEFFTKGVYGSAASVMERTACASWGPEHGRFTYLNEIDEQELQAATDINVAFGTQLLVMPMKFEERFIYVAWIALVPTTSTDAVALRLLGL